MNCCLVHVPRHIRKQSSPLWIIFLCCDRRKQCVCALRPTAACSTHYRSLARPGDLHLHRSALDQLFLTLSLSVIMVLPSLSEINAMNKSQLKDALTSILNADARSDLPSAIACLLAEVRKNQLETTQLRQEVVYLKEMSEELLSQTKEMKTEISELNAKIDSAVSAATSNNSNDVAGLTQNTPAWVPQNGGKECSTIDNVVRTSVKSALQEQTHKCEVIISKVEEKGQDEDLLNDVCMKISFAHRPVEVYCQARQEKFL